MLVLRAGPTYFDAIHAPVYQRALAEWEPLLDRVTDLLLRIPTRDTELVATVHYAWTSLAQEAQETGERVSQAQVLEAVNQWKLRRKPPIDDHVITQTIWNLCALGWIDVELDVTTLADEDKLLLGVG